MEAGNLECKNLRPVTPTEFHPLFVRGGGWLRSCKRKRTLLPFESTFDPRSAKFMVSDTHSVYTHFKLRISSCPTSSPSKSRTRRLLNGSGRNASGCLFLKVCSRFVCSCFVPRVILSGRSKCGGGDGRVRHFFFGYFIF